MKARAEHAYADTLGTLAHEPGTAVGVLDLTGRVHYASPGCLRLCPSQYAAADDLIGKTLVEIGYPEEFVNERLSIMRRIKETGRECLVRTIWNGRQLFGWHHAIQTTDPTPDGAPAADEDFHVLIVTRAVQSGQETDYLMSRELEIVESKIMDLGPLDVLSAREVEVLALIGQGLTTRQIADILHRSVKTIENHRIALGRKLDKANRVQLAVLAREAGLRIEDAALRRVRHGG